MKTVCGVFPLQSEKELSELVDTFNFAMLQLRYLRQLYSVIKLSIRRLPPKHLNIATVMELCIGSL